MRHRNAEKKAWERGGSRGWGEVLPLVVGGVGTYFFLDRYPTSFVNSNTFFGKSVVLFSLVFSYLKKPTTMAANATNEVDNAMKKLLTNPGVTQYLICNADGIAIKYHNMDPKYFFS